MKRLVIILALCCLAQSTPLPMSEFWKEYPKHQSRPTPAQTAVPHAVATMKMPLPPNGKHPLPKPTVKPGRRGPVKK
jgi:hypothetical protein